MMKGASICELSELNGIIGHFYYIQHARHLQFARIRCTVHHEGVAMIADGYRHMASQVYV